MRGIGIISDFLCIGFLCIGVDSAIAAPPSSQGPSNQKVRGNYSVTLRYQSREAATPLTSESLWKLDPSERNPHRSRWLVERVLSPVGWNVRESKPGEFAISLEALDAQATLYVRSAGPSYREFSQFDCSREPDSYFATRTGTLKAAEFAAARWKSSVAEALPKLESQLSRLRGKSEDEVQRLGEAALVIWKDGVEAAWGAGIRRAARAEEWRYYLSEATALKLCSPAAIKAARDSAKSVSWSELMDPPAVEAQRKVVVRAPAKRIGGLYTVRLNIAFGDKTLNGRFVVDTGSRVSLVSPRWLLSQGINPALVTVGGIPPQRVSWTGGTGWARRALAYETQLADLKLPLNEFLLLETELFSPPETFSSCCDGVLGEDFLRLFAVEFVEGPPPAVVLYAREGFSHGAQEPWVEVALLPNGDPVSSGCELVSSKGSRLPGARWDSGGKMAVEVHVPWLKTVRSSREGWSLKCGSRLLAENIPLSFPDPIRQASEGPLSMKVPAFSVGMELLGRGNFTLDLSNGRLWFDPALAQRPFFRNRSGLQLGFSYGPGASRILKVIRIQPGSPASALTKAGLKVGTVITEIDSQIADEMDLWDVEQRLAGAYAKAVTLKWSGKSGDHIAPLLLP